MNLKLRLAVPGCRLAPQPPVAAITKAVRLLSMTRPFVHPTSIRHKVIPTVPIPSSTIPEGLLSFAALVDRIAKPWRYMASISAGRSTP